MPGNCGRMGSRERPTSNRRPYLIQPWTSPRSSDVGVMPDCLMRCPLDAGANDGCRSDRVPCPDAERGVSETLSQGKSI